MALRVLKHLQGFGTWRIQVVTLHVFCPVCRVSKSVCYGHRRSPWLVCCVGLPLHVCCDLDFFHRSLCQVPQHPQLHTLSTPSSIYSQQQKSLECPSMPTSGYFAGILVEINLACFTKRGWGEEDTIWSQVWSSSWTYPGGKTINRRRAWVPAVAKSGATSGETHVRRTKDECYSINWGPKIIRAIRNISVKLWVMV